MKTLVKSVAVFLGLGLVPALANTVTHFGDGVGSDVPNLLNQVGIGAGNAASETTANSFIVPGAAGTDTTLTFTFMRDTGAFLFDFGMYPIGSVVADPVSQKQLYAEQAIGAGVSIFNDAVDNPGATRTVVVPGGTELGFFIVPDNSVGAFLANPSLFYPSQTVISSLRAPLFSVSDANPGELDQMLSFVANGVTLFTFEDLTRTGLSDEDFTDIAFTIDAELRPVIPPPPTGVPDGGSVLALLAAGLMGVGLIRRSRAS
ncbi:MAG: DUF4114 domain-containing protein [Verrucomicrobiae bacterium]|nr:DUF4114 domain-containing protein [Verrucomicrobiae bacterium]